MNNGETIWVERSQEFVKGTEAGNPFISVWNRGEASLTFVRRGRTYRYDRNVMLIAIGPDDRVYLVRPITRRDVYRDHLRCAKPSYVMLRENGDSWTVVGQVQSWAYGLARNQLMAFDFEKRPPSSLGADERRRLDARIAASRDAENARVQPNYVADFCRGKV